MEKNNEVIQTHPLVGWDISTVDSYDALMLRLHYQTPNKSEQEGTEVGQTLWLKRRTKNAKTFHDKCEKFNFRASNETAALTAVFLFIKWDHFG